MSSSLNILLVGSGGREHAIARALSKSPLVKVVYVAPGNGGTAQGLPKVENVAIKETDFAELTSFATSKNVNLVVPGPEAPLVAGIETHFRRAGIPCFGPSQAAAELEGSKAFSKEFMRKHSIPTAAYKTFKEADLAHGYLDAVDYDVVIKASGLAAGKGVVIPKTKTEAHAAIDEMMSNGKFGSAGDEVVIEEYLQGEELSILSFCDGYTVKSLPPAQDHKQIHEGDQGPMTGGMGCYSPCKIATPALVQEIHQTVLQPTIDAMRRDRTPFIGVLFTGFMITKSGPKVLEYNVRFGDPETETLLPYLKSDLAEIIQACAGGYLDTVDVETFPNIFSATVIAAAAGYPGSYEKGTSIEIDDESLPESSFVYHAGTARDASANKLTTSGGRVLAVNGTGSTLEEALESAYTAMQLVDFAGMQFRKDIAHRDVNRADAASNEAMTYASAGVSVAAGNSLVTRIKPYVQSTKRPGSEASIGGFGGVFNLSAAGFTSTPHLVAGTDGVGTKLNIAHAVGKHDTIGIDCVAMNVNDLVVQGAEPLLFLDCYTCGKLDVDVAAEVIKGVATGCAQAGCVLAGGETAEMPGIFTMGSKEKDTGDVYDLVGSSVGAIPQNKKILPDMDAMKPGDALLGLSSSGVHSNGFSLVRKIIARAGIDYSSPAPWDSGVSVGESLLTPTRIYVKPLLRVVAKDLLKGMAHITGGGLVDNIPRMLPKHLAAQIDVGTWDVPPVFKWLKRAGNVADEEFATAFNTGLGMVCVVEEGLVEDAKRELAGEEFVVTEIGKLVERKAGGEGTILTGFEEWQKW